MICLVWGRKCSGMEVRLNKADCLDTLISGGLLSKREYNCIARSVELGISIVKVQYSFELTDACEAQPRDLLNYLFKAKLVIWVRCGRREVRALSKHKTLFSGDIV